MRIIKVKEVYRCSFCGKLYQLKHACEKHEKACWSNPKNQTDCFFCDHYEKPCFETYGEGSEDYAFTSHYCALHGKEMLSGAQIVRDGRACSTEYERKDGEIDTREKMPTKCKDYTCGESIFVKAN